MNSSESNNPWDDDRMLLGTVRLGHVKVVLFLIGIIIASFMVTGRAIAADVTINESYVIVSDLPTPSPTQVSKPVPFIHQGDTVHVGDVVDITGVSGWPDSQGEYHLAWYGPYVTEKSPGDIDPRYIITLPGKTKSGTVPSQYTYHLDEVVFGPRPGFWYQYISNATSARLGYEAAGNLQVFRVSNEIVTSTDKEGNVTTDYVNGTYGEEKIAPEPLMPEIHTADFVVADGDPLYLKKDECKVWIFGSRTGKYGLDCGAVSSNVVECLEVGSYTLIMQYPGRNTIYDAVYAGKEIQPGRYGLKAVNIDGFDPQTIMDRLRNMMQGSDDVANIYSLEIEEPYITMDRLDEIYVNGQPVYDIRGYSNMQNGTKVTVTLDEGKSYFRNIRQNTVTTELIRTGHGNRSYYRAYLTIDYDQLAAMAEMHTLKAVLPNGKYVEHDIKISTLPADSFKPNATIKFTEARNPFVPTPPPVIVIQEKIVPGPTQIVKVTITPSQEQIHKEGEAVATGWGIAGIIIVILLAIIAGMAIWLWSVYRRARVIK